MKKLLSFIGLVALLTVPALAQVNVEVFIGTNTLAASTTTNSTTGDAIKVLPGKQMAIIASFSTSNTNSGTALTIGFDTSLDGNLWTTVPPINAAIAGAPLSTNVVAFSLLDSNVVFHTRFLRIGKLVSGTNAVIITRVQARSDQ